MQRFKLVNNDLAVKTNELSKLIAKFNHVKKFNAIKNLS